MDPAELDAGIAAAAAYESALVPALFDEWPPLVVAAARIGPGQRALDVACGTGVLARAAAKAVGVSGSVVGLDSNPGMLAVAKRSAPDVEWRDGTAEQLPFADQSFDAVVCQFGLMFFEDRAVALREMWRVLRPGGRVAVAVWAALADTPAYAAEVALIEEIAGPEAANALRLPFALGPRDQLTGLFAAAGVPLEAIATHVRTARFPSIRAMVETDLRGWLPIAGVRLAEPVIENLLEQAESALREYATSDGAVRFSMRAHIAASARRGAEH